MVERGCDRAKVLVAHNGCDCRELDRRDHSDVAGTGFLFVGNFKRWHGIDSLLRAYAMMGEAERLELTLVGDAIESVLDQTYRDLEVVVVDDGSTDGSPAVVCGYLSDGRVKLVRHDVNRGIPATRNTGIASSAGEFVSFLDQDDSWAPEKLDRQIRIFDASPPEVGAVFSDVLMVDDDGASLGLCQGEKIPRRIDAMSREARLRAVFLHNFMPLISAPVQDSAGGADGSLRLHRGLLQSASSSLRARSTVADQLREEAVCRSGIIESCELSVKTGQLHSPQQLIRDPLGTGSRPCERHGQNAPLVLGVECRGTATAWRASPRMESVPTIPLCIPFPPVEERSGDTQLAARGRDVAKFLSSL